MDLNKLFKLFDSNESEEKPVIVNEQLLEHPYIYMGLFKKLILNYNTFSQQLFQFMRSADNDLDVDQMEKAGVHMVYWRAYNHIEKIDLTQDFHVDTIRAYADDNFIKALDMCLQYYEENEEYEKCAFLKKILDITNLS
jgi:hypothetical protein